jgi:tetratricopeptide (TPR) repeat protein
MRPRAGVKASAVRLAVVAALVAGCGGPARTIAGPRSNHWRVAVSPHFEVYSDADEATLRTRIEGLERTWWALASFFQGVFPDRRPPAARLGVLHYRDCDEPFGGTSVGGYVRAGREFSAAVICEQRSAWRDEVIAHELTHLFNAYYIGRTPRWLNEGLAEYLSTLRVGDGTIELGRPSVSRMRGSPPWRPTVKGLFADRWRGTIGGYYAGAWVLVHVLFDHDALRPRLLAYLKALAAGTPADRAWADAFAGAGDAVERAYQDHLRVSTYRARSFPLKPPPSQPVAVQPLAVERVLDVVLTARSPLVADGGRLPTGVARRLAAELDALAAAYPLWGSARYWRARLAMNVEDRAAAGLEDPGELLRAHIAATPADARARAALVRLELDGADRPRLDAMEADVRALARVATTTGEMLAVASYYAARGRPETGIAWARRALAVWPLCDQCEHVLGVMAAQQQRWADALAHQERAIGMYAEADVPRAYRRAARRYRARLEAARGGRPQGGAPAGTP